MKKNKFSILLSIVFLSACIQVAFSAEEKKLVFRARETDLWFKSSLPVEEDKKRRYVEATLDGELFPSPKEIQDVDKDNVDRSTPEGLLSSYFSASEEGDVNWIVSNFLEDEQGKLKTILSNKKILKGSTKGAKKLKTKLLKGSALYNEFTLLFVEQSYGKGKKITEVVACKETNNGWKITNSLSEDKTFDIVFAAVSSGWVGDTEAAKPKIIHPTLIKIN